MIRDAKKWNLGVSKLSALAQFVREPFEQEQVDEYHKIVSIIEEASGEDLSHFKIDAAYMKPEKVGAELTTDFSGRPPRIIYSEKNRCNGGYFRSQLVGLMNYLPTMRGTRASRDKRPPEDVKPSTISNYTVNVENMHNSALMQASPAGTINQHFDIKNQDFKSFVGEVRTQLSQIPLSDDDRVQANADIVTVMTQIGAPKPKNSIVRECVKSLRIILENATGSLIATALLTKLDGYFPS
jgi:hypothetical protein